MELSLHGGTAVGLLSFAAVFVLQFTPLNGLSDDGCEDRLLSWRGHTFHVRRCPSGAPGEDSLSGVSDSQPVTRVPITVKLLGDFMEDLRNDSSTTYINFTEEFHQAVAYMFEDIQSFVGVEIQHYSAGSIVVEFDIIIQEEIVEVDDVIDVVSVIASSLASSNSTLGNFTVGEVAFVADDNTTSAVTPCDCDELNCVSVLGDCVAFCSSNINYCLNGGTCRFNRTTALVCDCLVTQDVFYTGYRCENEVVITRPPPTTGVDTESSTDSSENWTVFITTIGMTTASHQETKTPSSVRSTTPSTSTIDTNTAASVSVPSPTPTAGPVPPPECTFPFEYNNKVYHKCTTADSSRPWCAWDSVYRYSRWAYCEVQEPEELECSFPFIYRGNYYFSCTTENSYGRPWCAYDTLYQQENWRHCDGSEEVHKPENPDDTECAFPFVYKGNIYYSCTTEDYIVPWCARDRLYHPDRWVLCESDNIDTDHIADRTLPDERCQSQFWYKGELYTGCTDQDSMLPWCAWDVTYQKGRWSSCDVRTDKGTDGSGDLSGNGSGEEEEGSPDSPKGGDEDAWLWDDTSCHLPFVYKGKTYSGCTMMDSPVPWCSVDPVFQPGLGRWAFCKEEQSKRQNDDEHSESSGQSNGKCVFPFYYKDMLYTGCATTDSLLPWCAWDQMYRRNRWSYCENSSQVPSSAEGRPHDCVFPFHYGGHWNYGCIVSESGRPWCPWDQFYRSGRYSFCDIDEKNKRPPPDEGSGGSEMSGSGEGKEVGCTFPFYYNSVLYTRCALVDSLLPWCAWDKIYQEGRWSVCDFTQDHDNSSDDDTSGSGSGEGIENILCTFPFIYKGNEYAECTMDDSLIPWCGWDKVFNEGRWSYCGKEQLQQASQHKTKRPDKCVFPFNYKGHWRHDCAVSGSGMAWCAWDEVYLHGRFSFCDQDKGEGSAGGSGESGSVKETSGSGAEMPCTFPFKYDGIWYKDCIKTDSVLPWCAWDSEFQTGRWSVCDWIEENADDENGKVPGEIVEGQSNPWLTGEDAWLWDESSCVFPFKYKGVMYQKCTAHDSSHPWCSVDANYQHGLERWAYCKMSDDVSTKPTQVPEPYSRDPRCVSPFYYNQKWYSECTTEDSLISWCAWDHVLQAGRWSYCKTTQHPESRPDGGPGHMESSGDDGMSSSGDDMSGSGEETSCVFPFRYHGIWYTDCTPVDSIVPWCAWDRDYKEGRYTICEISNAHPTEASGETDASGSGDKEKCSFPFMYNGVLYTSCTMVDSMLPWCAWDQDYKEGRYSICGTSNAYPTEASGETDASGSGDEEKCSFPFMYNGVLYTSCTKVDSILPWCAWEQHYQDGRYSICEEIAEDFTPGVKDEKVCVFPFTYGGEMYDSCTIKDSVMPWCAWDDEYQFGRWSYCKDPVKPTSPPTAVPADCVFPFYYRGQRYNECTAVGFILPWCAWDPTYSEGRWSICKEKPNEEQARPSDENCAFPFVYKGFIFTECTSVDSDRPWCSWEHVHTAGRWSYCECTFPFQYQDRTYHRCTTDDWHEPWCALDSQYLPHRWMACTEKITTTVKPLKTTTSRTKKTTTPEVLVTTEYVTSAPRTDVVFETDFFTPKVATEVVDITTATLATTEAEKEFSTQKAIEDTTINMAESTVTELLPDVTEQVTPAKEEATPGATSVKPSETTTTIPGMLKTTGSVQDSTQVLQATTRESVFVTTEVMEVQTKVETTAKITPTDAPVTTDAVQRSSVVSGQTTASPATVQMMTSSVVPASPSVVMPGTASEAVETTTRAQATSSPAGQTFSEVPLVQVTSSAVVQDTATSAVSSEATTIAERGATTFTQGVTTVTVQGRTSETTSSFVVQGTTPSVGPTSSVSVKDTTASIGQMTSSVAAQGTASVGQTTSSVTVEGPTNSVGQASPIPGQDTTISVGQITSSATAEGTTASVGQTTPSVAVQGTTASVGQTSSVTIQGTTTSVSGQTTTSGGAQGTKASVGLTTSSVAAQGTTASLGQTSSVAVQGTTTSVGGQTTTSGGDQVTTASVGQTSSFAEQGITASVGQTTSSVVAQSTTTSVDGTPSVTVQGTASSVGQMTSSVAAQGSTASLGQTTSSVEAQGSTVSPGQTTSSVAAQGSTVSADETTSSVAAQDATTSVGQSSSVAAQGTTTSVGQTTSSVAAQATTTSASQATPSVAVQDTTASVGQSTSSSAVQGTTTSAGQSTISSLAQGTTIPVDQATSSDAAQGTTSRTTQGLTTVSQRTSTADKSTTTPTVEQVTTSRQVTTTSDVAQRPTPTTLTPSTLKPTTESSTTQRLTTVTLPVTTAVASAVAIEVQITSQNFTQELTNSSTTEYQQLAQELIDYLSQLYADVPGFQGIVINGFREGSVIAEFDVIIESPVSTSPMEIGSVLQTAVENTDSTLGNFVVGRLRVEVEGNFTDMSTCSNREGCGNGIKCTKIGGKCMAFCRTNAGYCYNGGQCSDSANDHLTCLCPWNLWRYYSGDRCQNVDTSIILYIIIGSCAGGLLIILTAVSWIAIMVKRSRNKSLARMYSVGNIPDPGQEGSVRRYGYSKDPFMRSLAEMLEQNVQDGNQGWNKQVGRTNESFLYQPEYQRAEEERRAEEHQQELLSKMRVYDAQVHDGMHTVSSTAGSQDITIHFPSRPVQPRDNTTFAPLHTYNPRFLKDVHL